MLYWVVSGSLCWDGSRGWKQGWDGWQGGSTVQCVIMPSATQGVGVLAGITQDSDFTVPACNSRGEIKCRITETMENKVYAGFYFILKPKSHAGPCYYHQLLLLSTAFTSLCSVTFLQCYC